MRTKGGFEIEDVGGEAQEHYENTLAAIERVGEDCHRCGTSYGSRVLCVWCEEELAELRDEQYDLELELDRRQSWLNAEIDPGYLFGDYLFDTGIDFAWDALQDALWLVKNTKYYDMPTHLKFARRLRDRWRHRNAHEEVDAICGVGDPKEVDRE